MQLIGFDLETKLFGPGRLAPQIICASFATRGPDGSMLTELIGNGDGHLADTIEQMLRDPNYLIVGHNLGNFDLACVVANWPHLTTAVFDALAAGRIHDTLIRERLLNLSTTGNLEYETLPDGSARHTDYSLSALEQRYIGRDRTDAKKDEDAWRQHYTMLDGWKAADYPADARKYALEDAEGVVLVHEAQEARCAQEAAVLTTQEFQVGVQFCLRLMSCWGIAIDADKAQEIVSELEQELAPERMLNLIQHQILWLPGMKRPTGKLKKDGSPCATTVKKETIAEKTLRALIVDVCQQHGIEVKYTEPSEKHPEGQVAKDKNFLEEIAHLHPALEEYQHRQYLSKLVTTELPRMRQVCPECYGTGRLHAKPCQNCEAEGRLPLFAPIVYPNFNVLVETGRTSSYAPEKAPYPSQNIQNVSAVKKLTDAEGNERGSVNIRECYVPRPGKVLCSIDYAALEFCSMGEVCSKLFGYSVMRDLINAGHDPHAYLGAQIALAQHQEFNTLCRSRHISHDAMAVYQLFKSCEKAEEKELRDFYKQYRKLAKPVGFGFPGGLGAKKFVAFARAHPYYVQVTEEQAKELREIWFATYPEMRDYFAWIDAQRDPRDPSLYSYLSPFGMLRAGATYTAACNGALLQTPAAEGAKLAVWDVVRACYDPAMGSILLGQHPVAFIHDEILLELDLDDHTHERAYEAARLMIEAMRVVIQNVKVRAEPALMLRWRKDAETKKDANGRLIVWEPEPAASAV